MARARRVTGLRPEGRLAPNARRVLAVRIAEVWSHERDVLDPRAVTQLHDMRIACKRLRYLLEVFAPAFPTDLAPLVDEIRELQRLLGEIHDRDLQIPALEEHLDWLGRNEVAAAAALIAPAPPAGAAGDPEGAFAAFRQRFAATRRADERPGLHLVIAELRGEREALYARFLELWSRLRAERFRARLEAALGLPV